MAIQSVKRVLILGGGFGGIYAAMELEKQLKPSDQIEITLVNRENFFLFTPMLHEVAASDLDATHIVNPIRKLLKRAQFFCGTVNAIDIQKKTVLVSHGVSAHAHELNYDYLIIALGAVTNFFGNQALMRFARTMKSLDDAMALRSQIIALMEEAAFECCAHIRKRLLTFVVAGAGFAGVETIASVNDFIRESLKFYPTLSPSDLRIVLVSSPEVILPELSERLGRYAQKKLAKRGVEIHFKAKVSAIKDGRVVLSTGEEIETDTLVWTAGTAPNPLLKDLQCKKERERIVVDQTLEVPEWPGVWVIGDSAHIIDKKSGKPHPPTAQHALREGVVAARNVVASIRGTEKKEFSFKTLGQLASLGRRTGVANIFGLNFSGFIAWWFWRTIYLMKLPRFEKKFRVALDWTLDIFFSKDLVQVLSVQQPQPLESVAADAQATMG